MQDGEGRLPCPGCRALFPGPIGTPHPYVGASQGCWTVYAEVLAKEYGKYGYPDVHRLTVDTYSVQHPGVPGRRSSQSVWVHLLSMYLVLERNANAQEATQAMRAILSRKAEFEWLEPPENNGSITILDVHKCTDMKDHIDLVHGWGWSVWNAWSAHHQTIFKKARPYL